MNIEDEEHKIVFTFKNAEEHKRFVQVLKQTRDSICGRSTLFCNDKKKKKIHSKSGSDLCEVIDKMYIYLAIE